MLQELTENTVLTHCSHSCALVFTAPLQHGTWNHQATVKVGGMCAYSRREKMLADRRTIFLSLALKCMEQWWEELRSLWVRTLVCLFSWSLLDSWGPVIGYGGGRDWREIKSSPPSPSPPLPRLYKQNVTRDPVEYFKILKMPSLFSSY